jgi:hypothetical protein
VKKGAIGKRSAIKMPSGFYFWDGGNLIGELKYAIK